MNCKNCEQPIQRPSAWNIFNWVHEDGFVSCDLRRTGMEQKIATPIESVTTGTVADAAVEAMKAAGDEIVRLRAELDGAQRHANNLGDLLAKREDELAELQETLKQARVLTLNVYRDRDGLEQDGERLSVIHNLLSRKS